MDGLIGKKRYNPNSFNALDGAIAYFIAIFSFFVMNLILPFPLRFLFKAGVDYFLINILSAVISQAVILIIALAFFKIKRVGVFTGDGFSFKLNVIDALMAVLLIFGVDFCFTSIHMEFSEYMEVLFGDLGISVPQSLIENSNYLYILIYSLVITPVLPAICEELLFRGVIMRGFKEKGVSYSIILSALCFALMHGSVAMLILQFLAGIAIAAVVTLTKNHLYGVLMHWASNLFVVLYALPSVILEEFSQQLSVVAKSFQSLFGVAFLIVSGCYFIKKLLAKKKREALGSEKTEYLGDKYIAECYILSENKFVLKNFDEDFDDVKNDRGNRFNYRGKFMLFNKKSNSTASVAVVVVGVIFATISLFV